MKTPSLSYVNTDNPITNYKNGYYLYHYDRNKVEFESSHEEDMGPTETYSCITVRLYGTPNYKDCVTAIIREYIDQNEEFDLINSFNKSADTEPSGKYLEYLNLLDEIKAKVKADFNV